ncbi:MAG: hypothetical protein AAGA60_05735 [Cyanobacteria bacterium P01_E01_bin.42]
MIFQGIGGAIGRRIGEGRMLILRQHWVWKTSLLALAAMMRLALIPLLFHQENSIAPRAIALFLS